ncbi:S9 family peptidase [Massilia sp. Root418]|uniref:alpha/beta hydrolase family protein n=1 Tax=Massilia sp. Root418 TaxID=1736532 RepID=UPI0009E7E264|nr:prolyl oligopeptidase family serine peptidase [Massilia sp. Root418]
MAAAAAALAALAGCGGAGGTGGGSGGGGPAGPGTTIPVVVAPSQRGNLVGGAAAVSAYDAGALKQMLESVQSGMSGITSTPLCGVSTYTVRYHTIGSAGEDTEASAAVMRPTGADSACSGARPVLLYAHGTSPLKSYDMSKLDGTEARLIAAIFAAQGYLVVAPNYAGYAGSTLGYHAYLDAEQQSADMVDGLRAARAAFGQIGASATAQLYVTGYSQGGYVALATQRAMQTRHAAEFPVTAAAGLSGPYALLKFGDAMFGGAPTLGATAFLPMLVNAGQHAGARLYAGPGDVYEAPYAAAIEDILPGTVSLGDLASQGRLPASALFALNSLPQADGSKAFFGNGHLVRTSYRDSYNADLQQQPCGAGTTAANAANALACAPQHTLRQWLKKNDLRSYTPAAPLLLCGGDADPLVPYYNTSAAADYFRAQNAAGTLHVVNVDSTPSLFGDDYSQPKLGFLAAKTAVRANAALSGGSGDAAVRDAYHAGLVAPFCLRAARDFFRAR